MHNMHSQVGILVAYVDSVTLDEAVQRAHEFVQSGQPHQITTVNVDFLRVAQDNLEFRAVINKSDLAIADGMPLVWASRWLSDRLPERVTGVELVDRCCEFSAREGYRVFLLGGEDGVAAAAADVLIGRYPGLQIVGTYSPPVGPFSEEEDRKMVEMIRESQADILFVAFGAPKQDLWIAQHRDAINVSLAIGVGGVFNFLIGRVKRAPEWMQQRGLEWLYRVIQEPRRLWKRYFVQDMPIFAKIGMEVIRTRVELGNGVGAPSRQSPHTLGVPQLSEAPTVARPDQLR